MRVTFNTAFRNSVTEITNAAEQLARWQRQVASQRRVQVPSDDPSASAAIISERTEMATLDQFKETTDSVEARLIVADTLLSDMLTNLTAAQTTAAAGRSTVLGADQRRVLAQELRAIGDTLLMDVNGQYRGAFIFSGTATLTTPFTKDAAGVVQPYAGNASVQQLDLDRTRSVEVTFDGGAVMGDVFQVIADLADAIEAGDMTGIDAGAQGLLQAFDRLTWTQSRVGLVLGDLDAHRIRIDAMHRASETRRSELEDADLVEAITRMQQAETAYRAALEAVSGTARLSLMDYLR